MSLSNSCVLNPHGSKLNSVAALNSMLRENIKSVTYSQSLCDFTGLYITVCCISLQTHKGNKGNKGIEKYSDVFVHKDKKKSEEGAAERVLLLLESNGIICSKKREKHKNHKNVGQSNTEKPRCMGEPEKCRCLSFYGLHEDTNTQKVIDYCETFGGPVLFADKYIWENDEKRYIMVVMEDYRNADDVIGSGGNLKLCGRDITIIKGHTDEKKSEADDYLDDYTFFLREE